MKYKNMRDYSHEEFVNLVKNLSEEEILNLSSKNGGYPVFYRMSLDERIKNIPFIQPGSAIIIRNEDGEILLQERTDRNMWSLPGGCQDLGEDLRDTIVRETFEETGIKIDPKKLKLLDTLSGSKRRNNYPNGDIVYNNTSLYLIDVSIDNLSNLKYNSETKRLKFFKVDSLPKNIMDYDLIETYINYLKK